MMVEVWIDRMIEDASKFINRENDICGKIIVHVQEMYKELQISKEQKTSQKGVANE